MIQNLVLSKDLVLLSNIFLSESLLKLITALLQFQDKLIETFINIPRLLFVKSLNLLLDMLNELSIIIIDSFSIEHEFI